MKHYSYGQKRRKWAKIWLIIFLSLAMSLILAVVLIRKNYYQNLRPVSASERTVVVTIPKGATVQEIARILRSKGLIRTTWAFEWHVRGSKVRDSLQAGTYSLKPSQSIQEIIDVLARGKVNFSQATIYPGKRLDEVRQSLINDGFSPDSVDAALDPKLYTGNPALSDKPADANLEGYLYPETFQKTATTLPAAIITASLAEMQTYLTPEIRSAFARQDLTVHQGIILASIIEREVSNVDDKASVAQIFLKRLRIDMALESDATASYGAILDGVEPSLNYKSAYNTYQNKGLPPGPISNVTKTSLQAVANPTPTDFLYFVSGDDGKTYFSRTLPEHEQLTTQHCKKLCQ